MKTVRATSVHAYDGKWINGSFIIARPLKRSDLADPSIKPAFIVYTNEGKRIFLGWTEKGKQRQFYIDEIVPEPNAWPGGYTRIDGTVYEKWRLKLTRTRGAKWRKTTEAVKKAMEKWFKGECMFSMDDLYPTFEVPLIRQVYPTLIADNIVSVQPMSQPASLIFYIKNKFGKPSS